MRNNMNVRTDALSKRTGRQRCRLAWLGKLVLQIEFVTIYSNSQRRLTWVDAKISDLDIVNIID